MTGVKFVAAFRAGVEDEAGDMLASEVHDVLRCAFKFEHFMVASSLKATGFELVTNLDLLVVLALVVKIVFQLDDEFNGLAKAVHDELLRSKGFDLGDLEALFLLGKFGENVLLLALELDLFNARFLFLFGSEDLGKETLLTVGLRSCGDDLVPRMVPKRYSRWVELFLHVELHRNGKLRIE